MKRRIWKRKRIIQKRLRRIKRIAMIRTDRTGTFWSQIVDYRLNLLSAFFEDMYKQQGGEL